jgi:hypothetical protein
LRRIEAIGGANVEAKEAGMVETVELGDGERLVFVLVMCLAEMTWQRPLATEYRARRRTEEDARTTAVPILLGVRAHAAD